MNDLYWKKWCLTFLKLFILNDSRFFCQNIMLLKATRAKAVASKQEQVNVWEGYIQIHTGTITVVVWVWNVPHGVPCLNAWWQARDRVWEGYGKFRRKREEPCCRIYMVGDGHWNFIIIPKFLLSHCILCVETMWSTRFLLLHSWCCHTFFPWWSPYLWNSKSNKTNKQKTLSPVSCFLFVGVFYHSNKKSHMCTL